MSISKDNPEILQEWLTIFQQETAKGVKKSPIYKSIAGTYGVSFTTVKYHLDAGYRSQMLRYRQNRYRKRSRRRIQVRRYNRNYHRFTLNPERYLSRIFDLTDQASAAEIAAQLPEHTEGVRFRPATVQTQLERYVAQQRGPPYLQEVEPGVYRRVSEPTFS